MTCGFVSIRLRQLMYVKLTIKSVTYVSGTFVTLDTGLNTFAKRGDGQEGPACDRIRSNFWWRQCGNPPILLLPPLKIDGSERDPRLSYSTEMALDPFNGWGRKASPGLMMVSFCIMKNDSECPAVAGSDGAHPMPHRSPENVSSSTNGAFKHRKNDQVSQIGGEDHSP